MIESVCVEIFTAGNGKKNTPATLGSGDIFGEMSVLTGRPHSAMAMYLFAKPGPNTTALGYLQRDSEFWDQKAIWGGNSP